MVIGISTTIQTSVYFQNKGCWLTSNIISFFLIPAGLLMLNSFGHAGLDKQDFHQFLFFPQYCGNKRFLMLIQSLSGTCNASVLGKMLCRATVEICSEIKHMEQLVLTL